MSRSGHFATRRGIRDCSSYEDRDDRFRGDRRDRVSMWVADSRRAVIGGHDVFDRGKSGSEHTEYDSRRRIDDECDSRSVRRRGDDRDRYSSDSRSMRHDDEHGIDGDRRRRDGDPAGSRRIDGDSDRRQVDRCESYADNSRNNDWANVVAPEGQGIRCMKPGRLSGATAFFVQFGVCAEYNNWSAADRVAQLKCCLSGPAAQILLDVGSSAEMSYDKLIGRFRFRFRATGSHEQFAAELRSRR